MPLPHPDRDRPTPEAMTRTELAEHIGQTFQRVYYWTAPSGGARRARGTFPPSIRQPTRQGEPAWFSPEDAERLAAFFAHLDAVQEATGDQRASKVRRPGRGKS